MEEPTYVSTGRLPPEQDVAWLVCVASVDGRVHTVGDAEVPLHDHERRQRRAGVNATGSRSTRSRR